MGPPGTEKRLAKAVAGSRCAFFSFRIRFCGDVYCVGAARVRDMFEQGRYAPVCFIDEIDAVGRQRGAGLGGGNDEREQTLNSLLVEMDGFDGHEGVIIIAATNRPDVLDNALLRPGRFDRQVTIDLPDLNGRHEILQVHAKKIALSESVNLEHVARNTPGFSGADLANLLNESALIAARYNKKVVDAEDIDEARDKISFGRERRKLMDDEDRKITAYHEAGHALVRLSMTDIYKPRSQLFLVGSARIDYVHAEEGCPNDQTPPTESNLLWYGDARQRSSWGILLRRFRRHPHGYEDSPAHGLRLGEQTKRSYGENKDHVFLVRKFSDRRITARRLLKK